jgi:signal transduction histidine kinase
MTNTTDDHGRCRRTLGLAALLVCLAPAQAADVRPIAEIKSLGDAETRSRPRAAIRGVVTWRDERGRTMFVQDATAGIYVVFPRDKPDEKLPDGVQLAAEVVAEGVVSPGGFASYIALESVRAIGPATLPQPRPFDDHRFFTGADDGSFVETTGIVRGVREEPFLWRLFVAHDTRTFEVECRKAAMPADFGRWCQSLVNGDVKLRGVSTTSFNARGEPLTQRLFVSQADWIEPLVLPEHEPFAAPRVAIDAVARYRFDPIDHHMIRTEGMVAHSLPGEALYLQEGTHGLRVLTRSPQAFAPGDRVEVAGFVDRGGTVAGLAEAVVRLVSHGEPPAAIDISPDEVAKIHARSADTYVIAHPGDYEGCLVRFPATLLERKAGRDSDLLVLAAGETSVTARLNPADLAALGRLEPGSRLLMTGVLHVIRATETVKWPLTPPTSMEIAPRNAADITILSRPSWWTPKRLALLLAAAGATLAAAIVWVVALRRQLRRQMHEIEDGLRMEAVAEERQRIAREFHDTLEQGLAALSLRLGVAASRTADEQARGVLRQQKTLLSWLQTETREFLQDLRDTTHAEDPFASTLAGHVEQLRSLCPVPIELAIEPGLPKVPAAVQHHLVRIVREAVHNAMRHADATAITVRAAADTESGGLRIEIADDGAGFDVAARSATPGHYGIRGMEERARRIGAALAIESRPGEGSTVRVTLPPVPADGFPVSTIGGAVTVAR